MILKERKILKRQIFWFIDFHVAYKQCFFFKKQEKTADFVLSDLLNESDFGDGDFMPG
jgi:hypothetical protein